MINIDSVYGRCAKLGYCTGAVDTFCPGFATLFWEGDTFQITYPDPFYIQQNYWLSALLFFPAAL